MGRRALVLAFHGVLSAAVNCGSPDAGTTTTSSAGGGGRGGGGGSTSETGFATTTGFEMVTSGPDCGAYVNAWPGYGPPSNPEVEAHCQRGALNTSGCPAQSPNQGSPCEDRPPLVCVYPLPGNKLDVAECVRFTSTIAPQWDHLWESCRDACGTPSASEQLPDAACGSRADLMCESNPLLTSQETANRLLGDLDRCCLHGMSADVEVTLKSGCATAIHLRMPDTYLTQCLTAALLGRRILCAANLACMNDRDSSGPP